MRIRPRLVLAAGSVALIALVVFTAASLGPDEFRRWLVFCGLLAVIAAIQSAASDPTDLAAALVLSLPPVIALVATGSPTLLIGPLGAALLVAAELNALSWDCQGAEALNAGKRRRLANIGRLGALGLAASLALGALASAG